MLFLRELQPILPARLKWLGLTTGYWRVDEFDAIETYKGDVWNFTTEGAVSNPDPSNGAVDVKQTQVITWSPNVYAASHVCRGLRGRQ
jgi:hypothetical protein